MPAFPIFSVKHPGHSLWSYICSNVKQWPFVPTADNYVTNKKILENDHSQNLISWFFTYNQLVSFLKFHQNQFTTVCVQLLANADKQTHKHWQRHNFLAEASLYVNDDDLILTLITWQSFFKVAIVMTGCHEHGCLGLLQIYYYMSIYWAQLCINISIDCKEWCGLQQKM